MIHAPQYGSRRKKTEPYNEELAAIQASSEAIKASALKLVPRRVPPLHSKEEIGCDLATD